MRFHAEIRKIRKLLPTTATSLRGNRGDGGMQLGTFIRLAKFNVSERVSRLALVAE